MKWYLFTLPAVIRVALAGLSQALYMQKRYDVVAAPGLTHSFEVFSSQYPGSNDVYYLFNLKFICSIRKTTDGIPIF